MLPTAALCLHLLFFFSLMPKTFLRLSSLQLTLHSEFRNPKVSQHPACRAVSFQSLCPALSVSTPPNPICLNGEPLCPCSSSARTPTHLRPKAFSCMPRIQILQSHFCNRIFLGISCNSSMCCKRSEVLSTCGSVFPTSGAGQDLCCCVHPLWSFGLLPAQCHSSTSTSCLTDASLPHSSFSLKSCTCYNSTELSHNLTGAHVQGTTPTERS